MGGRTWSHEEEQVFWVQLIPHSSKRLDGDLVNEEQTWNWVAQEMTKRMGVRARRKYTHLSVCEYSSSALFIQLAAT